MFAQACFFNNLTGMKPRILLSACLVGDKVRYDGQDKASPLVAQFFSTHAQASRVCPEVGAGFGVPRPAIALHQTDIGMRALGVYDPTFDATPALTAFSQQFIEQYSFPRQLPFQSAILKSRSPSCGYGTTPLLANGMPAGTGNGLFAEALHRHWPDCLITDEEKLATEDDCREWLFRCYIQLDKALTDPDRLGEWRRHYQRQLGIDVARLDLASHEERLSDRLK